MYYYDALGNVTEIANNSGELVEYYTYDVYGKFEIFDASGNALNESIAGNEYFFTGRRYEAKSGLYYYRARFYSPVLGRFLQPDPIGYGDGLNIYRYCSNNPVNFTDPMGLLRKLGRRKHINKNASRVRSSMLKPFFSWHYNRNKYNNAPKRQPKDNDPNWRRLPNNESMYHMHDKKDNEGSNNSKYVSRDGHHEGVYDANGNRIDDSLNGGTYNYYGPDNAIGHGLLDVMPYWIFGNDENDPTDIWERIYPRWNLPNDNANGESEC